MPPSHTCIPSPHTLRAALFAVGLRLQYAPTWCPKASQHAPGRQCVAVLFPKHPCSPPVRVDFHVWLARSQNPNLKPFQARATDALLLFVELDAAEARAALPDSTLYNNVM